MAKREEKQHSIYAPSASERWLHCPASVNLPQEEQKDTTAADEGTLAHALAEYKIRRELDSPWMEYEEELEEIRANPLYDPDMEGYTDTYKNYILNSPYKNLFIETKVKPVKGNAKLFGTSDCFLLDHQGRLVVIDFKFGRYPVKVEDNPQLMIYALGAAEHLFKEKLLERGTDFPIRMVIHQPRIGNVRQANTTWSELQEWRDTVLIPALNLLKKEPERSVKGDWCKWCKAKKACKAQLKKETGENASDPTDLGAILDLLEPIIEQLTALRETVTEQAIETIGQGGHVSHYEVVDGTPRKSWSDKKKLNNIAVAENLDIYKTLSPNEALKKLGEERFDELLGNLVKVSPGKPKLIRQDEKEGNE